MTNEDFSSSLKVVFIISGKIEVKIEDSVFILNQEDVIVINQCQKHSMHDLSSSIIAMVEYYPQTIRNLVDNNDNIIFNCNSSKNKSRSYRDIQNIFITLIYEYSYQMHKSQSYTVSLMMKLFDTLIEKYLLQTAVQTLNAEDNDKVKKMILYVNTNYQNEISLTDLSESLYSSISTLSRMFKKYTGIYFADYVNQVRCRFALSRLINTDCTITKIAVDSGFSNPSMFNKVFKKFYDLTPTEYRIKYKDGMEKNISVNDRSEEEIKDEIRKINIFALSQNGVLNIRLNSDDEVLYKNPHIWNKIINIGSFYSLTLANVQSQAAYLHDSLGFEYMRVWSIFSKKMLYTDGSLNAKYNYDKIDQVLDFFVSHNIKPYIDFGCKPNAILNSSNSILYENEYIVFESRVAFENTVRDFLRHIVRHYGKTIIKEWMIEFSFDSRHFYRDRYYESEEYDLKDIYNFIYTAAREIAGEIKICGISTIINDDEKTFTEFICYARDNNCCPDYWTCLILPYKTVMEEGRLKRIIQKEEDFETGQILMIKDILSKEGITEPKIIVSEFNNSISNRNFLNDSVWRASFIIQKMQNLFNSVEAVSILMATDWISSYYDSIGVVTGSIGLVTKDNIKKPSFYAIQFLNQLSDNIIKINRNYIVSKSENGSYYILCNNYKHFNDNYFLRDEDISLAQNFSSVFTDSDDLTFNFILENMESCFWSIKKRSINSRHGSILDEWKKLQYATDLKPSDIGYLNNICIPQMIIEKNRISNGILSFETTLEKNEVCLIHIYKD